MKKLFLLASMFLGLLLFAPAAKADCPSWTTPFVLSSGGEYCINPDGSPASDGDVWAYMAGAFQIFYDYSPSAVELLYWVRYIIP